MALIMWGKFSWGDDYSYARIINVPVKINFNPNIFFRDISKEEKLYESDILQVNHIQYGAAEFSIELFEEADRLFINLLDDVLCRENCNHTFHVLSQLFAVRKVVQWRAF